MKNNVNFPEQFRPIRDAVIDAGIRGDNPPDEISEIYKWLEGDGWSELVDRNPNGQMAIDVSRLCEDDSELRAILDIDDSIEIKNSMRSAYTQQLLKEIVSGEIDYDYPEITYLKLENEEGKSVVLGAVLAVQPGGWDVEWHGIFADEEQFIETMKLNGLWLLEAIELIDDNSILQFWRV